MATRYNEGKALDAVIQAMLKDEKARSKFAPDKITQQTGKPAKFTLRGKPVELGPDGIWQLKRKS